MKLRLLILILLGAFVMKVKYLVQEKDSEFLASRSDISELEQEIEVLQVEYIYLTRPNRILEYANKHNYKVYTSQIKNLQEYLGGL